MSGQRSPGEPTDQTIEDIEQPPIKITRENLDLALKILREVLDKETEVQK